MKHTLELCFKCQGGFILNARCKSIHGFIQHSSSIMMSLQQEEEAITFM